MGDDELVLGKRLGGADDLRSKVGLDEPADALVDELAGVEAERTELEEEHSGDEGVFSTMDKITKGEISNARKEAEDAEDITVLDTWLAFSKQEAALKKDIKAADTALDQAAYDKYPKLSADEVKALVVDDKWMAYLSATIGAQVYQVAGQLTQRIQTLAARYGAPLRELTKAAEALEARVEQHLEAMGLS
mgnify:FL=1